jgi:hypothetical protein
MVRKKKASKGKIRNVKKHTKYGINFRSGLELYCYEELIKHGLEANYETLTYTLVPNFTFIGKCLESSKNGLKLSSNKIRPWTYTPDFIGKNWVIECKGYGNEQWPLKLKMFKYTIKDTGISLYIPSNKKQVNEVITDILQNN